MMMRRLLGLVVVVAASAALVSTHEAAPRALGDGGLRGRRGDHGPPPHRSSAIEGVEGEGLVGEGEGQREWVWAVGSGGGSAWMVPRRLAGAGKPGTKGDEEDILGSPDLGKLQVSTLDMGALNGRAMNIQVRADAIAYPTEKDWVGIFSCDNLTFCPILNKYPVQFKEKVKPQSSFNFTVFVRPGALGFRAAYVSPAVAPYPEVLASSEIVQFPEQLTLLPKQIRTSLVTDDPGAMRIMWAIHRTIEKPWSFRVKVGTQTGKYELSTGASRSYTFDPSDFCQVDQMPAATVGFESPGFQMEAIVENLRPNQRYFYVIESEQLGISSEERSFATGPRPRERTKMVVFGDMGSSMQSIDGSKQHSFDFQGRGEITAPMTSSLVDSLVRKFNASVVNHIGDLSYATGALSIWDTWLAQIEPIASSVAYMTAIGNHEMGWSRSYIPGTDSEGECGVPYSTYFPFASQLYDKAVKTRKALHSDAWERPYYAYKHGNVHVVVMSTEHDFSPGSHQRAWIKSELASVDRGRTPWVLFLGHRPMYVSSSWKGDHDIVAFSLQEYIEPLLIKYRVDVAMWGHHHSYQRSCRNLVKGVCVDEKFGVQHVIVGMAGYDLSNVAAEKPNIFDVVNNKTYGAAFLDFHNSSTLELTFFSNNETVTIEDHAWIYRPGPGAFYQDASPALEDIM